MGNFINAIEKAQSRRHSWSWAKPEFAPILAELRRDPPAATPEAGLINESFGKRVWHLQRDGFDFAYKVQPAKSPFRYLVKPSLPMREARNYLRIQSVGIPCPEVLAVGDVRRNFCLKETFIATMFIADSLDGRVFMEGGKLHDDQEKKLEYCRRHFARLAQLHDALILHKAFHPRNLLFRDNPAGEMEIFWIDVARCRRILPCYLNRAATVDLHTFFRDMHFDQETVRELVGFYLSCRRRGSYPGGADALFDSLVNFRRRAFSKRKYQIFASSK